MHNFLYDKLCIEYIVYLCILFFEGKKQMLWSVKELVCQYKVFSSIKLIFFFYTEVCLSTDALVCKWNVFVCSSIMINYFPPQDASSNKFHQNVCAKYRADVTRVFGRETYRIPCLFEYIVFFSSRKVGCDSSPLLLYAVIHFIPIL